MFWTTKNGIRIPVENMTNKHLDNAIKYLEKMQVNDPGEFCYMGNSDAAEDAVDCENSHNEIVREEISSALNILQKEQRRRDKMMPFKKKREVNL